MNEQVCEVALTGQSIREQQVLEAIARLEGCAGHLEQNRDRLGDTIYADLVSQAYVYASFLSDCKAYGLGIKDPRIRGAVKEMVTFCDFIENELAR